MKFLSLLIAGCSLVAAPSFAAGSCDPTEVDKVVSVGEAVAVEVVRGDGLFWVDVPTTLVLGDVDDEDLSRNGEGVLASSVHVKVAGGDCSVLVDGVRVRSGDSWRSLRIAGNNVFAHGYFGERFPVEQVQVGLNLFLLQRAECSIAVDALIYKDLHPYLRPYPYPDPDC